MTTSGVPAYRQIRLQYSCHAAKLAQLPRMTKETIKVMSRICMQKSFQIKPDWRKTFGHKKTRQ
jgi:RNase P subunit RPR2